MVLKNHVLVISLSELIYTLLSINDDKERGKDGIGLKIQLDGFH